MTRTLILMRHAQAESRPGISDFDRSLTDHGREQAQQVGLHLAPLGVELAMVSAAQRARETFAGLGLTGADGAPVRAEYMKALYDASPSTITQRISETPDGINALLVLAHAPGIPSLAANFTWAASHREADLMQCAFPAASFAIFDVDCAWSELAAFDAFAYADQQSSGVSPVRPRGK